VFLLDTLLTKRLQNCSGTQSIPGLWLPSS